MKKLKHLFTILLTIFCITNVSYAASLDYGLYNVKNDVYHEQEIGMNMARTYLNQTMRVDAKTDGTYYYTVEFSGTEYMNKHRILVNGSQISTTKKSNSSNGTIKLTFKVKSLSSKINAMGRDVEFQIIPDFSTAKCVQKYSKKETTKTDKTDKTNKSDKKENTKSDSKKESTKSDSDKTKETEKVDTAKDSKKDSDKENEEKTESKTEEKAEESKEDTKEEKEDKTEEKTETEKVSAENTDEKKSSKMPLIIGGVVVLAVVGAVVVFTKKRK